MNPNSLIFNPRARFMIEAVRMLLPADWRYPTTYAVPRPETVFGFEMFSPVETHVQRHEYSCSAAALGILISATGVCIDDARLEEAVCPGEEGADESEIVRAGAALGVTLWARSGATTADVDAELAEGRPVLIDFWASFRPDDDPDEDMGHYAVIIASDERDYLVIDPYHTLNALHVRLIPRTELASVWWDTDIDTGERCPGVMVTLDPDVSMLTLSYRPWINEAWGRKFDGCY